MFFIGVHDAKPFDQCQTPTRWGLRHPNGFHPGPRAGILICPSATYCSGCSHWGEAHADQLSRKKDRILSGFENALGMKPLMGVSVAALPDRGLRDRLDFQVRDGVKGLWNKSQSEILDLSQCWQLSPELQNWLSDFRHLDFRVRKGSFRLRVSPSGDRGIWLDLSNEDVKNLFDSKTFLAELASMAHVEIGQRRKVLAFADGEPKLLKEGPLRTWTRTWIEEKPFDLYSHIGDFSQVGDIANRQLISALKESLPTDGRELVEFGAGNGNLTFAASDQFPVIRAVEFDSSVQRGFKQSLNNFEALYPTRSIVIERGDFQKRSAVFGQADTLLVNPPRSGVGRFFEGIQDSNVKAVVYMSCYPESMANDLKSLGPGWTFENLILIDQFPQTHHVEVMSRWTRK